MEASPSTFIDHAGFAGIERGAPRVRLVGLQSDQALCRSAARGSEKAFDELHERYSRAKILAMNAGFILCMPLGSAIYYAVGGEVHPLLRGAALAFSAGTFLHISLTDILPEVHKHTRSRVVPALLVLAGVGIMVLTSLVE